ncbi:GGDEF domain-containing protein [uncultured Ruminococcus sp.]|uniref:substrate-binding and GGDEF domain-containing protein n=1 Tax=uncultured Ruminococcus sp. TaxID=165186 RepID=UPI0025CF469E|nr:GGDEF domain-containing protein [uncultured Ruminococcus sp.]
MINSLKTIAFFGCSLTSRYRQGLCQCFNIAAKKRGMNIVYFNSLGRIGEKNTEFSECELDIIDHVDLDVFDGIIYDGEGYNVESMAEKVINKLRGAKCPVVSISGHVDGFYNIDFEDASGMRKLVEHFTDVHGHTRIGFMSGFLTHPDARLRLEVFRSVMREKGLPEDGAGIFEGDFWFHKGDEAADFFLSRPERPQSVVCANDYMAISLISALKRRGIKVPDDIAVSGFDGTIEGRQFIPHLTTATREREDIAEKAISLLVSLDKNTDTDTELYVSPRTIFDQSCGCRIVDYETEARNLDDIYNDVRLFGYCLNDAEAAMLKLNKVEKLDELEDAFRKCATNFGDYSAFFLFLQTDRKGRLSCSCDFDEPSDNFRPVIWIDEKGTYVKPDETGQTSGFIPYTADTETPHFYYIMSSYCAEKMFGYALIEMKSDDIFSDFYNIFLLNLSVTLERLWKNDNINQLYEQQKALYEKQMELSIHDELTGILNRRGFNEYSKAAIKRLRGRTAVCTMVIDMDGLKHINDVYGHNEGDFAIKMTAHIITECCKSGEIAGRAGGDEFYIYASDYTREKLDSFSRELVRLCDEYNERREKPYRIEMSFGAYLCETDNSGSIEDFLKISDTNMYEQKMSKHGRKNRGSY